MVVVRGYSVEGRLVIEDGHTKQAKMLASREPQRVCDKCHTKLQPSQGELRGRFANAMKFNSIDANSTWFNRTFGNSPIAFTLGHEVRKAAITLSNILPAPRKMGGNKRYNDDDDDDGIDEWDLNYGGRGGGFDEAVRNLRDTCNSTSSNFREIDGVKIPARLLAKAKGIAVVTVAKAGLWFGGEMGTGLVVARLPDGSWSAPSAIGLIGFSFGALIGAQISDHVFLLMTDKSVGMLGSSTGSVNLGADIGVAVGPVGRNVEVDVGVTATGEEGGEHAAAPIYTYSMTKGLYAGASFDGKVIATRHDVNEKFYGMQVRPDELLKGVVPPPPAAQPLYESLKRASVYIKTEYQEEWGQEGGEGTMTTTEAWEGDFQEGGVSMGGIAAEGGGGKRTGGGGGGGGGRPVFTSVTPETDNDKNKEKSPTLPPKPPAHPPTTPNVPTTPNGTPWPF